MKTLLAKNIYIPKRTHKDNNTRKWSKVIFAQDKKTKNLKIGNAVLVMVGGKLQLTKIVKVMQDGWLELKARNPRAA